MNDNPKVDYADALVAELIAKKLLLHEDRREASRVLLAFLEENCFASKVGPPIKGDSGYFDGPFVSAKAAHDWNVAMTEMGPCDSTAYELGYNEKKHKGACPKPIYSGFDSVL